MNGHSNPMGNFQLKQAMWGVLLAIVVFAGMSLPGVANAATVYLRAAATDVVMPDGTSVHIWGFAKCAGPQQPGDPGCTGNEVPTLPGPVLEAVEGQTLTVSVLNDLDDPISIIVPGMEITPLSGYDSATAKRAYTTEVTSGQTGSYTFGVNQALRPGTYLYESGSDQAKQVQMGLYGALIVRPADFDATQDALRTVSGAGTNSAFHHEEVLVLSEIDPAWHRAVKNGDPYNAVYFTPKYWLINGKAYPQTKELTARVGNSVLLRYVNAGSQDHVIVTEGLNQRHVSNDTFPVKFPETTQQVVMHPSQTRDVIFVANEVTTYPLYDRSLDITNGDVFPGGMITMIRSVAVGDTSFTALNTAPTSVLSGQDYVYDFAALDAANLHGNLTYSLVGTVPTGMTIDPATGRITWAAANVNGAPTTLAVQVDVTDDAGTTLNTQTFNVNLALNVNSSPVFSAGIADGSVTAPNVFTRTVVATDADADPLTYSLVGPPLGMVIDPVTGTITWTSAASTEGTYTLPVRVHVEDGKGGVAETAFNLAVVATAVVGGNPTPPTGTTIAINVVELDPNNAPVGPVLDYKFLITEDNTHWTDPATGDCTTFRNGVLYTNGSTTVAGQPHNPCTSHEFMASNAPVVYSGEVISGDNAQVVLPDGRYFISVLTTPLNALGQDTGQAGRDGGRHKMDGKAFVVGPGNPPSVTVEVVPDPVPTSRLVLQIFEDNHPLNGEWDRQFEGPPMRNGKVERFRVFLEDNLGGNLTTDIYGNPICAEYSNVPDPNHPDWPGQLVPGTGGTCYTDQNGFVSIENLARGKYGVFAIPPDGVDWIQTTTIEGGKVNDVWAIEGNMGIFPQETNALTLHGFARPCAVGACKNGPAAVIPGGTFNGQVVKVEPARPPFVAPDGATTPVERPWIALNDLSGAGELAALIRGNVDGTFTINNVPDGNYNAVVLDDQLDYITAIYPATMPTTIKNPDGSISQVRNVRLHDPRFGDAQTGPLPIPDWWQQLKGTVFLDENENGKQDAGEPGLPGETVDVFYRDGSPLYTTITDSNGDYYYRRFFPFAHFMVPAVGYARLGATGAHVIAGATLPTIGQPVIEDTVYPGPVLTMGNFPVEGGTNVINWGKKPYPLTNPSNLPGVTPAVNGGISGVVIYATTRNEHDAKKTAADPWEPGIAGVTLHLHEAIIDPVTGALVTDPVTGAARQGRLLGTVVTDDYNANPPSNCPVDPGYTNVNFPGKATVNGVLVDVNCAETLRTWNQVRPAVFDGGWQFFEDCRDPATANGIYPQGDPRCVPLAEGKYLVEVVPPAGYKIVTDNDVNTAAQGDSFTLNPTPRPTQIGALLSPSGCVGPVYQVTNPDSPNITRLDPNFGLGFTNDCTLKMVEISKGSNAGTEFHLFTDVPPPARVLGFVNDNLNLEQDKAKSQFGDKGGIAYVPVSIRDFRGREVVRTYTDENGFFEALVPSNNTVTIPSPAGLAPQVLDIFANDPGMPGSPDPFFNTNYNTLQMTFEFYPGKFSFADMALTPVNGFLATQNVACTPDNQTPKIAAVSQPFGSAADSITIFGTDFGTLAGTVSIGGTVLPAADVAWGNTSITVSLANAPVGPGQLEVKTANGRAGVNGMTIHVTGAGYAPNFVNVTTTIQAAIDAAAPGDVVLVPGSLATPVTYREHVIVYKGITLQGYGPEASIIDGAFLLPADRLAWNTALTAITGGGQVDVNKEHPIGQLYSTVLVLGTQGGPGSRIDGLAITGGRLGGGIHVAALADNTAVSNNLLENNFGRQTGGVGLGFPNWNDNLISGVRIHNNVIQRNGTLIEAGGIGVYDGVSDYRIDHNLLCANGSANSGGGVIAMTHNTGTASIDHNEFLFNWAFNDAAGLLVKGPAAGVGVVSPGTGPLTVSANIFHGNYATEDGGAMAIIRSGDSPVRVENNIISNNLALAQGAVKVQDAMNLVFINNTVAHNASVSTAGTVLLDQSPHSAGMVVYPNTRLFQQVGQPLHSDPVLANNIFWANKAYEWVANPALPEGGSLVLRGAFDLDLYHVPGLISEATHNMFSNQGLAPLPIGAGSNNKIGVDPMLTLPYDYALLGRLVRSAGEVAVHPLAVPVTVIFDEPQVRQGDYHVKVDSPALQFGASTVAAGAVAAPTEDIDGNARPLDQCYDVGADERPVSATSTATCADALTGITPTLVTGLEGSQVAFTSPTAGASYTWDFGDGSTVTNTVGTASKTYDNNGQYFVTLAVDGTITATYNVNIANVAPTVTLNNGASATGNVGTAVALVGTATDPSTADQAALVYVWNWDVGGTNETSQSLTPSSFHTYTAEGTYQVTLTATDPDGGATTSTAISVVIGPATVGGGTVQGDLNGDGAVTVADFLVLQGAMNSTVGDGNYLVAADLDADGDVDVVDYNAWLVIFNNQP